MGSPAHKFGNQPELGQILRLHVVERGVVHLVGAQLHLAAEAERRVVLSRGHDFIQAHESPAADKQNIRRVDSETLLLGVFSAALRGNGSERAFDDLQKRLRTPSPDTSRVMETFSLLRAILSISSI